MEKIVKKYKTNTKHIDIKKMRIFDWEVESEEKADELYTNVTFVRNNESSYYNELVKIEKEYFETANEKAFPIWILIALGVLTFILLTCFVIFGLVNTTIMDRTVSTLAFLIPGLFLAAVTCFLGTYISKKAISNVNEEVNRDTMYTNKVKELKDETRK